jgi:hypothetical protein
MLRRTTYEVQIRFGLIRIFPQEGDFSVFCKVVGRQKILPTKLLTSCPLLGGNRLFVRFYRFLYKLLRDAMGDRNQPFNPARTFPFYQSIHNDPDRFHRFQIVYMSALHAGQRWCHGVTSFASWMSGLSSDPYSGSTHKTRKGAIGCIRDEEKGKAARKEDALPFRLVKI